MRFDALMVPRSIEEQLHEIHERVRQEFPSIGRISVAMYDDQNQRLRTFANSTGGSGSLLSHYDVALRDVPSLEHLALARTDRVIDDLSIYASAQAPHSVEIAKHFGSSYTRPIFDRDQLRGFTFFDALERAFFQRDVVRRIAVYGDLVGLVVASSLVPGRMLRNAVEAAAQLSMCRDQETGLHLERVSRYTRIVSVGVASVHGLSDAFVEHLQVAAPLHDLGKIGIPDKVLLKRGLLEPSEIEIMRSHVIRGVDMVDRLVGSLGMSSQPEVQIIRNVVRAHHEAWDGSGYPDRLVGEQIPLEARVVAVADVFDALTSARPYKVAWSVDRALGYVARQAGTQFDPQCVEAFLRGEASVRAIHEELADAPLTSG